MKNQSDTLPDPAGPDTHKSTSNHIVQDQMSLIEYRPFFRPLMRQSLSLSELLNNFRFDFFLFEKTTPTSTEPYHISYRIVNSFIEKLCEF